MTDRERILENALQLTTTALDAFRCLMESLSDGSSYPSIDTIKRYHDLASDALAASQAAGIDPIFTEEPDV